MICSCLLQSGQKTTAIPPWWPRLVNMDNAVNLPTRKTEMKWMETLPQCDFFFLWMVTERTEKEREKKNEGKEKLHSLKGDEDTYMAKELPKKKTSKQAWKHCPRRRCILWRPMGRLFLSPFLKSSTTRRYFKELLLPLLSLPPFPKHDKQMKEPREGRCRLGSPLSFYLPSPPHLPSALYPRLLDSSLPPDPPTCLDGASEQREGFLNLLVDIVPLFKLQ